ncbi:PANK2 [Symbiodinium natans]|uniref:PANK2 protein n=1 Tax=Symbiodinium natans TaxID=878477 RepID=A0A812UNZ1_9DINO|nr:PANK2 [Symbiodinium natans]
MAYPAEMQRLQQEVAQAAASCKCEATLQRALNVLTGERSVLVDSFYKAKEVLQHWNFLEGWRHAKVEDYMPSDAPEVLKSLRESPGHFGLDIGGTLAKAAQLLEAGQDHMPPSTFGKTGTFHKELSFQLKLPDMVRDVHFLSGATFGLEMVLKSLQGLEAAEPAPVPAMRRVVVAGGGAHRLAQLFRESLTVEVVPFKEMESLVSGLALLHHYGPEDEVFQILPDGTKEFVDWPDPMYPCIIVNIGSGVSVLRVDQGEDGSSPFFTRLGGTATGGAAFLGLVRLLTSAKTFHECLALAQKGDARNVNKLVSDIYGEEGCGNLGLAPGLTAAHFAKVTMKDFDNPCYSEADVATAVLTMVVSASTVIARAFSRSVASTTATGSSHNDARKSEERKDEDAADGRVRRFHSTGCGSSWDLQAAAQRSKAQLLGAAPYPGERKTPVFFVGGFLAENRRAWEIISRSSLQIGPELRFVRGSSLRGAKPIKLETGKVFGEIALMSEDCKRKGRCTALKHSELLSLHRDDFQCIGMSQENGVRERAAYLRCVEEGLLEDMSYVDLQAMAGNLTEKSYVGEHEILQQGAEVDRVIFVKSGFCKLVRQLHPKYTEMFCRYAHYGEPMPNPFAEGEGGLRVGQKGVWPDQHRTKRKSTKTEDVSANSSFSIKSLAGHQMLKKVLPLMATEETGEASSPSAEKRPGRTDTTSSSSAEAPKEERAPDQGLQVVVDIISKGSSVGVMELMEGLTYQCTVISAPLAEIYSISKFDFIRTHKTITHRLFCNYKARLSDSQLIWRLVQKYRWDHYKRGLLSEIRSWNSSASRGIIDREDPVPMTGASSLGDETCLRVGRGEKLWDARAQTPPNETYDPGRAVKQIFHVDCSRDDDGKPVVTVEREQRDASMDDFERKLQDTMATARYRDKLRRTAKNVASGTSLENGSAKAGANAVALTQELEEAAKKTLEEYQQVQKERIEGLRQAARDKVKSEKTPREPKRSARNLLRQQTRREFGRPPSASRGSRTHRATVAAGLANEPVALPAVRKIRSIPVKLQHSDGARSISASPRVPRQSRLSREKGG